MKNKNKIRIFLKACMITIVTLIFIMPSAHVFAKMHEDGGFEITRGTTWYVDDDAPPGGDGSLEHPFQHIQDAINVTGNGDTVFVYNGTYYENIIVSKSIILIGEDRNTTIIDGTGSGDVVCISADCVNMSGFTIQNSGSIGYNAGVKINSKYNTISGNIITDNFHGICMYGFYGFGNNTISENTITKTGRGFWEHDQIIFRGYYIYIDRSYGNIIIRNNVTNNPSRQGIWLEESDINTINENTIQMNYGSISLYGSSYNTISNNTITNVNKTGILIMPKYLINSHHNTVSGNVITDARTGIKLFGASDNSTVTGNIITNVNGYGISNEAHSSNNTIAENTITNVSGYDMSNGSGYGISNEGYSNNNIIAENTITNVNIYGIKIWDSTDITITENTITNSGCDGIIIDRPLNITIMDNTLVSSYGISIRPHWGNSLETWDSHTIENNTANGKPILYYKNINDVVVPTDIAQVIMSNCTNFTIQNINFSNMSRSIQIGFSSHAKIIGNTFKDCIGGIYLDHSSRNNITGNNIADIPLNWSSIFCHYHETNFEWHISNGIYLYDSSNNNITKNTITNTIRSGICLWDGSSTNIVSENSITNNGYGIFLSKSCRYNSVSNNTIRDNNGGIFLNYGSSRNTLAGNTIVDNNNNIDIGYIRYNYSITLICLSNHNIISENTITDNNNGIGIINSDENTFSCNTVTNNNDCGFYMHLSDDNILIHNDIADNNKDGIRLKGSSYNSISFNNITNNSYDGIVLSRSSSTGFHSDSNIVFGNTIADNGWYGIRLTEDSNDNHIYHNNFINNQEGNAYDECTNNWDYSYPYGGNYWSDFDETSEGAFDDYHGEYQDEEGADGIVDLGSPTGGLNPYAIYGGNNQDVYPFIYPDSWYNPPYEPSNPHPEDGATSVDPDLDLSWTGGDPDGDPVTYDIYFGTNSPPSKIVSNHSEDMYDPGVLVCDTAYYWKIVAWDIHDASTVGPIWSFTTRTNHPPYEPSDPNPENGAVDLGPDVVLSWSGGDPDGDPVTYDIYFGTNSPPSKIVSNHSEDMYDLGLLDDNATYYWQIVAWDNCGLSTSGPMWNFTTVDLVDVVYVDDNFDENTSGWGYDHFDIIDDGIGAVAKHGTVIVYSGTYYGTYWDAVLVDKSVNIIGENKNTTIIDGNEGEVAVFVAHASRVNLSGFTIRNAWAGVGIIQSDNVTASDNVITNNNFGIYTESSSGNNISENTIRDNVQGGIYLTYFSNDNMLFHNNFINNTQNAYDEGGNNNSWDNGYPYGGNYWSDFDESGEGAFDDFNGGNQDIPGSDGIVDQGLPFGGLNPYNIPGGSNQDMYPLMEPWVVIPGDCDDDGDVDQSDLGILLAAWDSQPGDDNWDYRADIDGDGHVYHSDLGILLANWGTGT